MNRASFLSAFAAESPSVRAARDSRETPANPNTDVIVFKRSDRPIVLNFISDITSRDCSRRLLELCILIAFT